MTSQGKPGDEDAMAPPGSSLPGTPPPATLERLKFYRSEVQFEWGLISNRVSAYITSQSFLVIAFAMSMGNLNPQWGRLFRTVFPCVLAVLGMALSVQTWLGIHAACDVIRRWHEKQDGLFANGLSREAYQAGERTEVEKSRRRSLLFPRALPWVFGVAWVVFLVLALALSRQG